MWGNIANGSSSLLFIISAFYAITGNKNTQWKIANVILVFASYLCNAHQYQPVYLLMDYSTICMLCLGYINSRMIDTVGALSIMYEYDTTNQIAITKNVVFAIAVMLSIANTKREMEFWLIALFAVGSVIIYGVRYYIYCHHKTDRWNILLTWMFHICITTILCISSNN
jgi:hypothetical protein